MTDTIEARVARGAALMDEKLPGWIDRIDVGRLNLGSACNCILGQEFTGRDGGGQFFNPFDVAVDELFNRDLDKASLYGFDISDETDPPDEDDWDLFAKLTAEWKRVILARRSAS